LLIGDQLSMVSIVNGKPVIKSDNCDALYEMFPLFMVVLS